MKRPPITHVHVDNVSHDGSRASAGFQLGEFRYHLWFSPRGCDRSAEKLYKNPVVGKPSRRSPTMQLNPMAQCNAVLIAEMWRQIDERGLIVEAIRTAKYEDVRNDAENDNAAFDRRALFRERIMKTINCYPDAHILDLVPDLIADMEWAQTQ